MENIPDYFKPVIKKKKNYPIYVNGLLIEEYFYEYFTQNNLKYDRIYLPIFWTKFYSSRGSKELAGKSINDLKVFIKKLDTSKKYFTIIQHCRGILCDVTHLDILLFSCGGAGRNHRGGWTPKDIFRANPYNIGDIPLPLLTNPELKYNNAKKDILCSFVGNVNTHKYIRQNMCILLNKKNIFLRNCVDATPKDFDIYYNILCRSKFSLCPRGIGITSFRLYESLQCLAIPIYIYDDIAWLPYKDKINWNKIAIIIHVSQMPKLYKIITSFSDEKIKEYQNRIQLLLNEYFTLDGTCKNIDRMLSPKESDNQKNSEPVNISEQL